MTDALRLDRKPANEEVLECGILRQAYADPEVCAVGHVVHRKRDRELRVDVGRGVVGQDRRDRQIRVVFGYFDGQSDGRVGSIQGVGDGSRELVTAGDEVGEADGTGGGDESAAAAWSGRSDGPGRAGGARCTGWACRTGWPSGARGPGRAGWASCANGGCRASWAG